MEQAGRALVGASGYGIVQIRVDTGPPMRPVPMRALGRAEATSMAAPALEAGSSRVQVGANGTIELEF